MLLQGVSLAISPDLRIGHLVTLQLQIIVIAPKSLVPLNGLASTCYITFQNLCRHFTSNTGRTNNQVFVIFLEFFMVSTRTVVEAIHPRVADELNQVLIAIVILGEHDKVIAAKVIFRFTKILIATTGYIHLTSKNRFKGLKAIFLALFVNTIADVMKFFNAEHVSMVGNGHTLHSIANSFIY